MSADSAPVVLLTGAGSGIGLTVLPKLLKSYNAKVVVLTLCPTDELTAVVEEYGPSRLVTVYGDACKEDVVAEAVEQTISSFGYMTDLISCVGTMLPVETIRKVPLESYKRIYDINLFSVVSLVQKSIPHLLASAESGKSVKKPSVVIVTSGVDLDIKWHGWSAYCTSKAALTRFIQLLAHEERDLDVYGVLPVVTKSPMVDMIYSGKYDHVMLPEERKNFDVFLRQGKVESPEHIAEAMVKATMGQITPDSPEVERNTDDTLFIRSLYVPEAAPQS